MADQRELSRRKARRTRATVKEQAQQKIGINTELAANALIAARRVVADQKFVRFLVIAGTTSIPECLLGESDPSRAGTSAPDRLDRISLEFAVAWRFLHPFFGNAEAKAYLDAVWPGFVWQMKDAFISLVIDGPFPHAMSGHRGRRHSGRYFN